MSRSTPDPAPRHRDDLPVKRTWRVPVLRMSVVAGVVAAILYTPIQPSLADRVRMLYMAAGLVFVVGAIDSLFLFVTCHKP